MDPGSGDLGEIVYSGLPGNTVGMATMVDMSEASKPKSGFMGITIKVATLKLRPLDTQLIVTVV